MHFSKALQAYVPPMPPPPPKRKVEASANANRYRSYQSYQNGAVSNPLTDGGSGGEMR
jgi:hypothetical protein